jgi:hypothetical protein
MLFLWRSPFRSSQTATVALRGSYTPHLFFTTVLLYILDNEIYFIVVLDLIAPGGFGSLPAVVIVDLYCGISAPFVKTVFPVPEDLVLILTRHYY